MTEAKISDPNQRMQLDGAILIPFFGEPEDIGNAAVFLTSEESSCSCLPVHTWVRPREGIRLHRPPLKQAKFNRPVDSDEGGLNNERVVCCVTKRLGAGE